MGRVNDRSLSTENIRNVVNYPSVRTKTKRPARRGGAVWIFEKSVDSVRLKVVAEIKREECWVITAYELH